jgi:hypothetical protein
MTILLFRFGREHAFAWKMIQSPLCDTLLLRQGMLEPQQQMSSSASPI